MGKFGEWLQEARKILGLTQAQLARRLNLSVRSIKRYEQSKPLINIKILPTLRDLLNERIQSLMKEPIMKGAVKWLTESARTRYETSLKSIKNLSDGLEVLGNWPDTERTVSQQFAAMKNLFSEQLNFLRQLQTIKNELTSKGWVLKATG